MQFKRRPTGLLQVCCVLMAVDVAFAPPPADQQVPHEVIERFLISASWLDSQKLKEELVVPLIEAPAVIIRIKDGADFPGTRIGQGNIRDDRSVGFSWQSTASVRVIGSELPCRLSINYEYEDNMGKRFHVATEIMVSSKREELAVKARTGSGVLLLSVQPHSSTARPMSTN